MAGRTRKIVEKKLPAFRTTHVPPEEEQDLKKVKEKLMKELEEKEKNGREWLDNEMEKNLKKP